MTAIARRRSRVGSDLNAHHQRVKGSHYQVRRFDGVLLGSSDDKTNAERLCAVLCDRRREFATVERRGVEVAS